MRPNPWGRPSLSVVCPGAKHPPIYRRRLPHWIPDGKAIAVVFRLAGSKPRRKPGILVKDPGPLGPVEGPIWLADSRLANVVEEALIYGAEVRDWYELYAHVIMPDHVHVLLQPHVELSQITQWLKGRTARMCNRLLARAGPFWQYESYDHWIRSYEELLEAARYIENNPVRAGFVRFPDEWQWSSARCADGQTTNNDGPPHGGVDGC